MNAPILITGLPRSGTSLTAGIIHRCGGYGGWLRLTASGGRGTHENREVMDSVIIPLFTLLGVDPRGQAPLPDIHRLLLLENLRTKIETMIKFQGYKSGPWYLKSNLFCLVWPTIHDAFPEAKWVIVRRKDDDVVYSCMKTAFMDAYETPEDWQGWVNYYKGRFLEMTVHGIDVREIWPSKFIEGDYTEVKEALQGLGLRWNEKAVQEFISPEKWRSNDGSQSNS